MRLFQFFVPLLSAQFAYFGILGCGLICLAVVVSALGYRGKQQERYSLFNHFISELGEKGVSARANVFNGGLIISGLVLLPFVIGLGQGLRSAWGTLATIAGVVTALACAAVGLFPMNRLSAHIVAAMTFFRAGFIMVILFTLAVLTQPVGQAWVPKWAAVFGALAILVYGSFLVMVRGGSALDRIDEPIDSENRPPRARFYALTTVEWGIFFATVFWFLAVALVMV